VPVQHTTQATGTNDGTKQVSVNGGNEAHTVSEYIDIPVPTSTPAAPAAGSRVYTSSHAGKAFLTWKGPADVETMVQPHLGEMAGYLRLGPGTSGTTTTLCSIFGLGAGSTSGYSVNGTANGTTLSITTPSTGSLLNNVRRYSNVTQTTSSTQINVRPLTATASRVTGYLMMMTVNLASTSANNLGFFGLLDTTSNITTNVDMTSSTANAKIGIGFNVNTGNWKLICGAAAASPTVTDLGANFPINTTALLRVSLFCERDTATVFYLIENMTTGSTASGSITTNLPAAATLMCPFQYMSNNTNAAAAGFTSTGFSLEQYF